MLWTDEVFEIIAVEFKGRNPKFSWEVVEVYRAPNEDMRVIERLANRTGFTGNTTKSSIIGGDLNLPYADWIGNGNGNSGTQARYKHVLTSTYFCVDGQFYEQTDGVAMGSYSLGSSPTSTWKTSRGQV